MGIFEIFPITYRFMNFYQKVAFSFSKNTEYLISEYDNLLHQSL